MATISIWQGLGFPVLDWQTAWCYQNQLATRCNQETSAHLSRFMLFQSPDLLHVRSLSNECSLNRDTHHLARLGSIFPFSALKKTWLGKTENNVPSLWLIFPRFASWIICCILGSLKIFWVDFFIFVTSWPEPKLVCYVQVWDPISKLRLQHDSTSATSALR